MDFDDDEGPYDEADSLAEHAIPSPPWLGSDSDYAYDFDDLLDDWLLDDPEVHDDYFDQSLPVKRKRKLEIDDGGVCTDELAADNMARTTTLSKRRKISPPQNNPKALLTDRPIVVWRTRDHDPFAHPILSDGSGTEISVLKDWRERLENKAFTDRKHAARPVTKAAFAVVVERRPSRDLDQELIPPVAESKTEPRPRGRGISSQVNGTASTASSRAKANSKSVAPKAAHKRALAGNGNPPTRAVSKRKATELEDEDELQADRGGLTRPKKRTMTRPTRATKAESNGTIGRKTKRELEQPAKHAK